MEIADQPPGCTPLSAEDLKGLRLHHITTRAQLDQVENLNIAAANDWIDGNWNRRPLDEDFMYRLHGRMFGEVWAWAGKQRRHELQNPIFSIWPTIPAKLRTLFLDIEEQAKHPHYSADEMAARFHHRLVAIHPCANGNGRLSRAMADVLLRRMDASPFTWGSASLNETGPRRDAYIQALHDADNHDYTALLAFVRS